MTENTLSSSIRSDEELAKSDSLHTSKIASSKESSNKSQLTCCICYDNDKDNNLHCEKMFTQCGHYFHKACYARANRKKNEIKCPYCQTICPISYENKYYDMNQLKELSIHHYEVMKNIIKIMYELNIYEYSISGSFAVHLHQMLHHKNPKWMYNDIDIYSNYDFHNNIGTAKQTRKFLLLELEKDIEYQPTYLSSNIIQKNSKYGIYLKKKEENKIELNQILLLDFVTVIDCFNTPDKIISSFDLDCCKIAITVSNNIIKFYIHNDFYVDSYRIQNNCITTMNRVNKYRNRGFNCENLENYSEKLLNYLIN